jgi:hypothetical protein
LYNINQSFDCQLSVLFGGFIEGSGQLLQIGLDEVKDEYRLIYAAATSGYLLTDVTQLVELISYKGVATATVI